MSEFYMNRDSSSSPKLKNTIFGVSYPTFMKLQLKKINEVKRYFIKNFITEF